MRVSGGHDRRRRNIHWPSPERRRRSGRGGPPIGRMSPPAASHAPVPSIQSSRPSPRSPVAHDRSPAELLRATLAAVAPGTELRDGLERILRGRTGALIVLGHDEIVEEVCTGGFVLDVEFSATRLRELAKMDGAIVIDEKLTRILRAAVQLV